MKNEERREQEKFCLWLKMSHPDMWFITDLSGIKLTPGMAKRVRAGHSWHKKLDVLIIMPGGDLVFLEFKKSIQEAAKNTRHNMEQREEITRINREYKGARAFLVTCCESAQELFTNLIHLTLQK